MADGHTVGWRERPTSAALAALCVVVFVAGWVHCLLTADAPGQAAVDALWRSLCTEDLRGSGGLESARVWLDGEWWRVLSAGLVHGSWLHLILNTWSLWAVGLFVERAWGWQRALGLFSLAAVGGCLASLAWAEAPMVVGASGGILGMATALLVGRVWGQPQTLVALAPVSARALASWLVILVVLGAVVPVIAQAGHVGGMVVGALMGAAWETRGPRRVAAWVALVGVLGALGWGARAPQWRPNYHTFVGYAWLERGAVEPAMEAFDRALAAQPEDPVLANAVAYGLAEAGEELDRARALVAVSLAAEPENADYLDTLGWILCKQGDAEGGLEQLRAAQAATPEPIEDIDGHVDACAEVAASAG